MIEGDISLIMRQTVQSVSYDTENGLIITFFGGAILHVWGGIPHSYDVNIIVKKPT